MTAADALLQCVLDSPDDDGPRLVYADFLEEAGEAERSEFIRVQCRLAEVDHEKRGWRFLADGTSLDAEARAVRDENPLVERLRRRERELLAANAKRWAESLPPAGHFGGCFDHVDGCVRVFWGGEDQRARYWFCRGFAESVSCTLACWEKHGPAVVRAQPVQRCALMDRMPEQHTHAGGVNYSWYLIGFSDDMATIPELIFDLLQGGRPGLSAQRWAYDTEAEAQAALSAAALAWARAQPPPNH